MSELTNSVGGMKETRLRLLVGVSAMTLIACISVSAADGRTNDEGSPTLWIELGGQVDRLNSQVDPYEPPFIGVAVQNGLMSGDDLQSTPKHSIGGFGQIEFDPSGSPWTFAATLRFGRSNKSAHGHQEVAVPPIVIAGALHGPPGGNDFMTNARTADYNVRFDESHTIVDFEVGKDVGFGILGRASLGHFGLGVRFGQFSSKERMRLQADPDPHWGAFKYNPIFHGSFPLAGYYQAYRASPSIDRNFRGLGPSLAWNETIPVVAAQDGNAQLAIDWGANVAVLFGRQKVRIQHQTTGDRYTNRVLGAPRYEDDRYVNDSVDGRSHSVVVPNLGGTAGISLNFPNAKISFGYRAEVFFGAVDGGVNARDGRSLLLHGPYATFSVGLGG